MKGNWPTPTRVNISDSLQSKLQRVIDQWVGTPYHLGMQKMRVGVDCIRFVCAIADAMEGAHTDIDSMPGDRSMHDPEGARAAMRLLMRKYGARRVMDNTLEPGDVAICGPEGGGPGHAMIAGTHAMYHATGKKVQETRLAQTPGHEIFHAILRIPDKETRWAQQH